MAYGVPLEGPLRVTEWVCACMCVQSCQQIQLHLVSEVQFHCILVGVCIDYSLHYHMAHFNVVISTFRAIYCSCSDWMDDKTALFWRLSAWDSVLSGVSLQVYMCQKIQFKQMGKYCHNACYEYLRNRKYPSNFCQHVVSNHLACALHHSPVQSPLYFHQDPWIKVAWVLKTKGWISCGSSGSETGYYWLSLSLSLFLALALITAKWNIYKRSQSLTEGKLFWSKFQGNRQVKKWNDLIPRMRKWFKK